MSGTIRGLTLRHPWAWAFLHGKDVENRTWRPERQGGRVGMFLALHGGSIKLSEEYAEEIDDALEWIIQRCGKAGAGVLTRRDFPASGKVTYGDLITPGIVAVAQLVDVRTDSPSPWAAAGQQHWCLKVTPLPEPVPHRGAQGLWTLEPDALERVREGYQSALKETP